jgi:S1-C subfamily serine protease
MPGDVSQIVYALGRIEPSGVNLLGTAFAVGQDKVATAFHVVGANDKNLAMIMPRMRSMLEYQDTSDNRVTTMPLTVCAADPIRDLCILQLPPGSNIPFYCKLSSTDATPPGAPVVTCGFPHANHGRMVLTLQSAAVGARVLIEAEGIKTKHIVLNTQARSGQSGGPVFDVTMTGVIAVLLGSYAPEGAGILLGDINPQTLHQTTHAISAEYLKGML